MGSPVNDKDRYFATYDWAGLHISYEVTASFDPHRVSILDVGAGWPKYRSLLSEYPAMDACEIWQPNIEAEELDKHYRKVFHADICDLEFDYYDVIIMGDVFEHIERTRAKKLLRRILPKCQEIYIAVPFEMPQDEYEGNPYEIHVQDDLTPELMDREFFELKLHAASETKGLYVKRPDNEHYNLREYINNHPLESS